MRCRSVQPWLVWVERVDSVGEMRRAATTRGVLLLPSTSCRVATSTDTMSTSPLAACASSSSPSPRGVAHLLLLLPHSTDLPANEGGLLPYWMLFVSYVSSSCTRAPASLADPLPQRPQRNRRVQLAPELPHDVPHPQGLRPLARLGSVPSLPSDPGQGLTDTPAQTHRTRSQPAPGAPVWRVDPHVGVREVLCRVPRRGQAVRRPLSLVLSSDKTRATH